MKTKPLKSRMSKCRIGISAKGGLAVYFVSQEKGLAGRGGCLGRNEGNDKDLNVFMSANVFLVPCVSYLLGSKGNMTTGLPGVFTVFRLRCLQNTDPRRL